MPDTTRTTIPLTRGQVAIVDDADYELLSRYKWWAVCYRGKWYAEGNADGRQIPMHRFLTDAPRGSEVDHRNGNGLDNRRENLRVCSRQQNARNHQRVQGVSPYRGVQWCSARGKWKAVIRLSSNPRRVLYLGAYTDPLAAARAYDNAALAHFGDFASLNFPEEANVA